MGSVGLALTHRLPAATRAALTEPLGDAMDGAALAAAQGLGWRARARGEADA
jgi:hypothetical protein